MKKTKELQQFRSSSKHPLLTCKPDTLAFKHRKPATKQLLALFFIALPTYLYVHRQNFGKWFLSTWGKSPVIQEFSFTMPSQAFELQKPGTVIITEKKSRFRFLKGELRDGSGTEKHSSQHAVLNRSEIPVPSHPLPQEPAESNRSR